MRSSSETPQESRPPSTPRLLRWYASHFRGDVPRIAVGVGLAVLQSFALVPIPLVLRHIVDVDIPAKDYQGLLFSGAAASLLYLTHALMSFSSYSLTLKATKRVTEMLRARMCMQLQQLSLQFHDREKASELHSRVVLDTERIDVMGNAMISHGLTSLIMFTFAAVLLAHVNLTLFGITCLVLPLYYLTHRLTRSRMKEVHHNFREGMEGMSSLVNDLLQSIRLVKTFAREDHEQDRAVRQFQTVTRRALAMTIFSAFYGNFMGWLSNMTTLMLYVVGGWLIIRSSMTLGDLIAFVGMVGFLINPMNTFMSMLSHVYSGLASLKPVHRLLTINDPLEVSEGKHLVPELRGSIEFDHVSFFYETPEKLALRNITLSITPGETIALVGESGAGKSTFASLLLGFYHPTSGAVRVDGRDLRDVNLRSLRERIGVVSQDNVLLNTSIRDNLKYGSPGADEERITIALRDAHAFEFVIEIPGGLDAIVGDRGVKLSGGQRQRIAIARALLKNPRILILDEATSALDSESEARIQAALERLQANRTCIIIAHRLSTVMAADRILVFREGEIVESGSHGELIEHGGEYARLCERQFRPRGTKHETA